MILVFLEVTLQGYLPGAKLNSETLLASNTHIFVGNKLMISNISLDILEIFLFFSKNGELAFSSRIPTLYLTLAVTEQKK